MIIPRLVGRVVTCGLVHLQRSESIVLQINYIHESLIPSYMYMNSDLCTIGSKYATGLLLINLLISTGRPHVESFTLRRFPAKKVERGYHWGIGELNCSSGEGQGQGYLSAM